MFVLKSVLQWNQRKVITYFFLCKKFANFYLIFFCVSCQKQITDKLFPNSLHFDLFSVFFLLFFFFFTSANKKEECPSDSLILFQNRNQLYKFNLTWRLNSIEKC